MALINLQNINVSFGGPPLLEDITLQIEAGERLCLVGRNGEGKSTLMKLISGDLAPDSGSLALQQGIRITRLPQEVPKNLSGPVYDVVAGGLGKLFDLLASYHTLSNQLTAEAGTASLAELERVQHDLETAGGWQAYQRVETVISRLKLQDDASFSELSGGLKRRVLLARALVGKPNLLLLDEPTNHLDIEAISWLEDFLLNFEATLLFVTHDRMLLKKLATRIIELDRGRLTSWPGNYELYLKRKQEALEAEATQNKKFDKKLAREEAWIRQGIKARRTRNEGRVHALQEMREKRRARRNLTGKARLMTQETQISGKLVAEAKNIHFSYADKLVINDFSTSILRGDKVGIIGPNGCGKTTLLQLMLGDLTPQTGSIRLGTNLAPAYFDQLRTRLDEEKSVADNIADGNDTVLINGKPKHIIGYLQDFLFAPSRARSPAKILSGGERNRLLLAKLFANPANILILDEPTNDLDIETLELLEELLLEYKGTVLLVSHDRAFLNNVVTSSLVFEEDGRVVEYSGGYDDWLVQKKPSAGEKPTHKASNKPKPRPQKSALRKLTFKEQRELDALPQKIEALEAEQQTLYHAMAAPEFYQQEGNIVAAAKNRIEEIEQELHEAFERWEELEGIKNLY